MGRRGDWSADRDSSYDPRNHTVSRADAVMGLVLYACLLGALAALPERTAPLPAIAREAPASPPGSGAAVMQRAGC
ncbi:hypothetical protein Mnod_0785 [Methylobacterium nodulans ORS 2060]|uniref:Uncharacterized protein n=2 Tax=Methylobacterium nodulans TaxID=114616 RepID=B8IFA5_METNO|nr:hypothetical protein Mnod_0785 [Methylobacterium nodulans ORS 2060]